MQPGVPGSPRRCDEAGASPAPEGLLRADTEAARQASAEGTGDSRNRAGSPEFTPPREDGSRASHGRCRPPGLSPDQAAGLPKPAGIKKWAPQKNLEIKCSYRAFHLN